jgi:putative transposase
VEKAEHSITILCRCLRVTRSGFYAWQRRPESTHARDDRRLKVLVRVSFEESKHRYGSPRVHEDLLEQHEHVSRKRVVRLMQEDGLHARLRKRYKLTTMSDHDQPVAANLLDRQFEADAPNQRWVGDTTEFVIGGSGKLYLAAVLDLFSRFSVGWAVSAVNDRHVTIKALEMALKRRCPEIGLLHHSDQGCTYASEDYQSLLGARGIVCSMSRRGNCYDNAVMESFFSTVKTELREHFDSCGEAKMELFDYIEVFYNQRRRHSTIGQISPAAYERRAIAEGMDAMENCTERSFPTAPTPLNFLCDRGTTKCLNSVVNLSTESDQAQCRSRNRQLVLVAGVQPVGKDLGVVEGQTLLNNFFADVGRHALFLGQRRKTSVEQLRDCPFVAIERFQPITSFHHTADVEKAEHEEDVVGSFVPEVEVAGAIAR